MADFKNVTDTNGNIVFPITHINAVKDSNGNSLSSLIVPEKQGGGIGTCSTSSGTALAVSLSGYELVQNGIVAVTFQYDVPASATLNINSKGAKAIYYKGAAITANVIKAGDTVMFAYDGTNYVVTSLGSGGSVESYETLNVTLSQNGGSDSDLTGLSVTITNTTKSSTIYSGTWNGSKITVKIPVDTNYSITVGTVTGYALPVSTKNFRADSILRDVTFNYFYLGVYIEDTDGELYTSSGWNSSKTPNALVFLGDSKKLRISLTPVSGKAAPNYFTHLNSYCTAGNHDNGIANTAGLTSYAKAENFYNDGYAGYDVDVFRFPNGMSGYMPSIIEVLSIVGQLDSINACRAALGLSNMRDADVTKRFLSSDFTDLSTPAPQSGYVHGPQLYNDYINPSSVSTQNPQEGGPTWVVNQYSI